MIPSRSLANHAVSQIKAKYLQTMSSLKVHHPRLPDAHAANKPGKKNNLKHRHERPLHQSSLAPQLSP
jgi:hypothetical protein